MEIKEMTYSENAKRELLAKGQSHGFNYYILNLGTHPVAYVEIPKTHPAFGKDYDDIDIDVHGGLTYGEKHLNIGIEYLENSWFIGWDYMHCNDYSGYLEFNDFCLGEPKKWTTEEILEHVEDVCLQLENM